MRRAVVALVAIGSLVVAVAMSEAASKKSIHYTVKITGAGISTTHSVFQFRDSHFGDGAGTQTVRVNASGTGGSDSEISYYGNATLKSKGTFKLGKPNAQGIATLTGSGHDISGTGRARGFTSTYTYTGTFNTKTGVYTVRLTGTYHQH
jgi:hypothetical protein